MFIFSVVHSQNEKKLQMKPMPKDRKTVSYLVRISICNRAEFDRLEGLG